MINKLKYATINDIQVSDLVYYSEENIENLIKFCQVNRISYIPSKDRMNVYKLEDGKFSTPIYINLVKKEMGVNPYDLLFEKSTIEKFEKVDHNEIRFVVERNKIKGVVHIVDYNNEFLQVEFYRALYRFENYIRQLLIKNNLNNEDFIFWVTECSKSLQKEYDRNYWASRLNALKPSNPKDLFRVEKERREANPFQTFYFKELVEFAIAKKLITRECIFIDEINSLRNSIAHNKDFTSTIEHEDGQIVYNFKNLKAFVFKAQKFFEAYEYLEELIKD